MRVLMWINSGAEIPGGHRVQLTQTASALRELGVEVDEHDGPVLPSGDWDIVHGFQLDARSVGQAKGRGLPVALSTIYWGMDYSMSSGPDASPTVRDRAGRANRGLRYLRASLRGRATLTRLAMREAADVLDQIRAWSMADVLLPNADGEARNIRDDLGVLTETVVVPNAIDADLFTPGFDRARGPGTVLCVGRIEPHKNQLGTIEALRDIPGIGLTVVGPPHPHHAAYYERVRQAAHGNVTLLPGVDHAALPDLYARHHTHVLATWYETTGLVSLEAAASGCTIVTTDRGHAREYFDGDAWYCNPGEPESIRRGVLAALEAEQSTPLLERIEERYTWTETARQTLSAYDEVLTRTR